MALIFKAGVLYDGTRTPPIEDGVLLIDGDTVKYAGPAADAPDPDGAYVVDYSGATVMPGMIDAHVHVLSSGSESSGDELRSATEDEALLQGVRNAQLALASGITTLRDLGDWNYLSLKLRDNIEAGGVTGPRLVCSGPPITSTAGQCYWKGIECDTPDELRRAVRTLVKNGVDCIKLMGSGGNATPWSNPEASQFDFEGFRAVAEDARRLGKMVAVHVHGVESIRFAVATGMDTLEHCPFRANGTIEYDEAVVEDIVRKGLIVSLAMPATWYRMTADQMREARNHPGHLWERRADTIRRMHKAGVKLVVSSDQGSTGTRIDELALLMEYLVDGVGLPSLDVFHGVTGLAAESVGLADSVGTLEPGKLADVAVFDGNPFENPADAVNVRDVYKGGTCVVHNGGLVVPNSHAIASRRRGHDRD